MPRNTTLTGGTLGGIKLLNASAGTFNFDNTVTLTNIGGTDVDVDGGAGDLFTGTVNIASVVNNNDGHSVSIQGVSGTDAASRLVATSRIRPRASWLTATQVA